ncbi:MAG: hypothetical protein HYV93_11770 [Candidatus Rokubacteria bacterium]|nr:hypothetical protein [Candidatus Rokubacteria bacterium]
MSHFLFWQRWLVVLSVLTSVFGLLLAFLSRTALFDVLFNRRVDPVFWGDGEPAAAALLFQGWIYGVVGATVAGWGVMMAFVAWHPFRQKQRWAWNCLAAGMLVWFVVDTSITLHFGVVFNAAFNTILFAAALVPLLMTRKEFSGEGGG